MFKVSLRSSICSVNSDLFISMLVLSCSSFAVFLVCYQLFHHFHTSLRPWPFLKTRLVCFSSQSGLWVAQGEKKEENMWEQWDQGLISTSSFGKLFEPNYIFAAVVHEPELLQNFSNTLCLLHKQWLDFGEAFHFSSADHLIYCSICMKTSNSGVKVLELHMSF